MSRQLTWRAGLMLRHQWTDQHLLLSTVSAYRVALGLVFLLLFNIELEQQLLGSVHPMLYLVTTTFYLGINSLVFYRLRRSKEQPGINLRVFAFFSDIGTVFLLQLASNAWGQPLALLYIIFIVVACISLPSRLALLITALATLAVLAEATHLIVAGRAGLNQLAGASTLALVFFLISLMVQRLASRTRRFENLASEQAEDIAELQHLNELIVQRMRTGILLVDGNNQVLLGNQAARAALGIPAKETPMYLPRLLVDSLESWRNHGRSPERALKLRPDGPEVAVSFAALGEDNDEGRALLFLEDIRPLAQKAQEMKLASLGSLTGSIAHEIRNPLGAVSHAAQLLAESPLPDARLQRLAGIIQGNSLRMNRIVENVLAVSRQSPPTLARIDLRVGADEFAGEFRQATGANIVVQLPENPVMAYVDKSQLMQVLRNLVDNALEHGRSGDAPATVTLTIKDDAVSGLPVLEVSDNGPGVSPEHIDHIFEPFYTTRQGGTGLGLFICRELCRANQVDLSYVVDDSGRHCFRLSFGHHDRKPLPKLQP